MQITTIRFSRIGLAIGLAMLALSSLSYGQVQPQNDQADCASASDQALRAYQNVRIAILNRNVQATSAATQAFWDVEAAASDCEQVRTLAKTLTEYNLGKSSSWAAQRGFSGRGQTGSGGIVSATVLGIEILADNYTGGSTSTGATGEGTASSGSSGWSGDSASSGSSGSSSPNPSRRYRITLRKDDGSIEMVTQDATPDFRSGDRVQIDGNMISREN